MHDEPRPDAADPGDLTERHAITPDAAAEPSEGQASPATPATPASTGPTWPSATADDAGERLGRSVGARSTSTTAPADPAAATVSRRAPSRAPTGPGRGTRPRP